MNVGRFMFWPSWVVTRFGFIRPLWGEGMDEWHNHSRYLIVPLVGMFTLFDRDMVRDGLPHAPEDGFFRIGCAVCDDVKAERLGVR